LSVLSAGSQASTRSGGGSRIKSRKYRVTSHSSQVVSVILSSV